MSNVAQFSASLSASILGSSSSVSGSAQVTIAGDKAPLLYQDATTSATTLGLGGAGSIGVLLFKVLFVDGTQTVKISLDSGATQVVSVIAEGQCMLLPKPTSTLYIKSSVGTLTCEYKIVEQ